MADLDGDVMGFAIDHRERTSEFCHEMMMAISEEMRAEGLVGSGTIPEFRKRCVEVMSRRRDCPGAATCRKYRRSVLERGRPDRFGIFGERPGEWIQTRIVLEGEE